MATRKDVAARAGVSTAVVSYVINNSNYVSEEKRKAVRQAIEELNYHPNFIAKSLKTRHTSHIALIVDDIQNEYFNELYYMFEKVAYECGYYVSMFSNRPESLRLLINYQVAGAFIFTTEYSAAQINTLARSGIATILCPTVEYPGLDPMVKRICLDLRGSMRHLTDYLIGKGHRRIAYFSVAPISGGRDGNYRYQGFRESLENNGIEFSPEYVQHFGSDMNWGIIKLAQMVASPARPTAIIAGNDSIALRIMGYLQQAGHDIPDDFAIVGAGNIQLGAYHFPTLSTFDYNNEKLVRLAVANIVEMNNGREAADAFLDVGIILRESV